MANSNNIRLGTTFRSPFADSRPLWRVVNKRSHDTFDCEVDRSEQDWAGHRKVFGAEEIVQAIRADKEFERQQRRRVDFWSERTPGETLHYHDGFGRFVRGVVVVGEADGRRTHVIKPTALVGDWERDLPRWTDAGFLIEGGYWVRKIGEGDTFQPHPSCIWESAEFAGAGGRAISDPTNLPANDLRVPQPTEDQAEAARLRDVMVRIKNVLGGDLQGIKNYPAEYRRRLDAVSKILSKTDLECEEGPAFRP